MRARWWKEVMIALFLGVFFAGEMVAQEGIWQGTKGHPMLRATLKDKEKYAQKHAALVEVETQNVGLVSSGGLSYEGSDMGSLEYQVDQGPVVATSDTRVMFRDLTPGKHTITVSLVGTDYRELGAKAELEVDVP